MCLSCAGQGLGDVPHGIILQNASANGGNIGPGLQIFANEFNGGAVWYEGKQGKDITEPLNITDVRIEHNSFGGGVGVARGSRASKTLSSAAVSYTHLTLPTILLV